MAKLVNEVRAADEWGLDFGQPAINVGKLREWKNDVIGRLTGGLGQLSKRRDVKFVQGRGQFDDAHALTVTADDGTTSKVEFDYAIVATGSEPTRVKSLMIDSPRLLDSTTALDIEDVPEKLLVIGGGYIGLELGTVYHALGSKVTVVEMMPNLLAGVDADLVEILAKELNRRFEAIHTDTRVLGLTEVEDGIKVKFAGLHVEQAEQVFDKVLMSVGRTPNSRNLGADALGVEIDKQGFITVDRQRKTTVDNIYAIGDVAGQPMLAHKATYEARIAVEAIAGKASAYDPQAIPAVVFTDPEIAWAGLSEMDALNQGKPVKIARFPWGASGRAMTMDRVDGLTKLVLDPQTERILGVGICGVGAGEMIAEGTLAIEMGATAADLQMTIHAHPTLSETVMEAAEVFFGHSPHVYHKKRD